MQNSTLPICVSSRLAQLLVELRISQAGSFELYADRTRDRDDVRVVRCRESGVIVLESTEHCEPTYYADKQGLSYWGVQDRTAALAQTWDDDIRRAEQFGYLIRQRDWCDVGTGNGGILDQLGSAARAVVAVEPQAEMRQCLTDLGYQVFPRLQDLPDNSLDVVTLFHVFEHLLEPLEALKIAFLKLRAGGVLVIEVPHAEDALLSFFDSEPFRRFTLWSEHLILHTRSSLKTLIQAGGFERLTVEGFQRYPLANHLRWLKEGKPGGHAAWGEFRSPALDSAYASLLSSLNLTDTLIAIARKPAAG